MSSVQRSDGPSIELGFPASPAGNGDRDLAVRPRDEANELLERESLEAAVAEVGYPRLIGPEDDCGIFLRPSVQHGDDGISQLDLEGGDRIRGAHGSR